MDSGGKEYIRMEHEKSAGKNAPIGNFNFWLSTPHQENVQATTSPDMIGADCQHGSILSWNFQEMLHI